MDERLARFNEELGALCKTYNVKLELGGIDSYEIDMIEIVDATTGEHLEEYYELPFRPCLEHTFRRYYAVEIHNTNHKVFKRCVDCMYTEEEVHEHGPVELESNGYIQVRRCATDPNCHVAWREIT